MRRTLFAVPAAVLAVPISLYLFGQGPVAPTTMKLFDSAPPSAYEAFRSAIEGWVNRDDSVNPRTYQTVFIYTDLLTQREIGPNDSFELSVAAPKSQVYTYVVTKSAKTNHPVGAGSEHERPPTTYWHLRGRLKDRAPEQTGNDGSLAITIEDDRVNGQFQTPMGTYRIRPVPNEVLKIEGNRKPALHIVAEVKDLLQADCVADELKPILAGSKKSPSPR
jgi:hypothetical protein